MRIILASASPRRRELLARIIPEFEVIPSNADEIIPQDVPGAIVRALATQKAEAVAGTLSDETDTLLIGADTIVVLDGEILGKPRDAADARRMLTALSGRTHEVYTGVCLLHMNTGLREKRTFEERTEVTFDPMTAEEIEDYIRTGDPMDKAGAYGIQSGAGAYIQGIAGDYDNVVGLPVTRLRDEMRKIL